MPECGRPPAHPGSRSPLFILASAFGFIARGEDRAGHEPLNRQVGSSAADAGDLEHVSLNGRSGTIAVA